MAFEGERLFNTSGLSKEDQELVRKDQEETRQFQKLRESEENSAFYENMQYHNSIEENTHEAMKSIFISMNKIQKAKESGALQRLLSFLKLKR